VHRHRLRNRLLRRTRRHCGHGTAGEYLLDTIVAVWHDEEVRLFVLPPCGRCREFIRQIDPANTGTEVVLGLDATALLRELLPAHDWPQPLELG